MSLRGEPIEETATLPDGRTVRVRVGVPEDPYIPRRELDTVDIELYDGEARELVREVVRGLESGELEPTAAALEPLADQPR